MRINKKHKISINEITKKPLKKYYEIHLNNYHKSIYIVKIVKNMFDELLFNKMLPRLMIYKTLF